MAKKSKPIDSKYKFEYVLPKPQPYIGTYIEGDLAGRRRELQDRTISERISDEELRNEIRMLEREEPSAERERLLEEMRERAANYRSR